MRTSIACHQVLVCAAASLVIFLNLRPVDADAVSWNYKTGDFGGPDNWYKNYSECGGVMQSPININSTEVLYDPNLELFDFSDYERISNISMRLENVGGHTAEVIYGGASIYLRGGGLPDLYKLDQFHFHWGQLDKRGSEHSFNGQHFPLEIHLVHHQNHLTNVAMAAPHPFGLAVIAFFFKIGAVNKKYDQLLDHFGNISDAYAEVDLPTFAVKDLLPSSKRYDYFRYQGSLTTPPCYESVIWSICTDLIEISEDQANKFRELFDSERHHLVDDFRPIQNINQRSILTTHTMYRQGNAGSVVTPQISTLVGTLLCLLVICWL